MKLSPSKRIQDELGKDPNYALFMEELLRDFRRIFSKRTLRESNDQELVNFAFVSFVLGCSNALNEKSEFFKALDLSVSPDIDKSMH